MLTSILFEFSLSLYHCLIVSVFLQLFYMFFHFCSLGYILLQLFFLDIQFFFCIYCQQFYGISYIRINFHLCIDVIYSCRNIAHISHYSPSLQQHFIRCSNHWHVLRIISYIFFNWSLSLSKYIWVFIIYLLLVLLLVGMLYFILHFFLTLPLMLFILGTFFLSTPLYSPSVPSS